MEGGVEGVKVTRLQQQKGCNNRPDSLLFGRISPPPPPPNPRNIWPERIIMCCGVYRSTHLHAEEPRGERAHSCAQLR